MKRSIAALSGAVAAYAALSGGVWAAEQVVGSVNLVKTAAYERLEQSNWEDLLVQDNVFSNQHVRTPPNAALHVKFADGTDFRLGADSEATIDSYVYDPSRGTGKAVTTLGKGVFRFISGTVKDHTIVTPSATLGIRGTDFYVLVADLTGVLVNQQPGNPNSGIFIMPNCPGAVGMFVGGGKTAGVLGGSCSVTPDLQINIADRGLDDDGGIDPAAGRNQNGPQFPPLRTNNRNPDGALPPIEQAQTTSQFTPPPPPSNLQ